MILAIVSAFYSYHSVSFIISLYVDDLLIVNKNANMKFIVTKNFEIKDLRVSNQILRMKIFKDKKKRKIWIKQKCYIYIFYPYFNKEDDELVNTLFPTTC